MKLIHTDTRSILPRVESLYLTTRVSVILAIIGYMLLGPQVERNFLPLYSILAAELVIFGVGWFLTRRRSNLDPWVYFATIIIDILLITGLTHFTGGASSDFYLFYFTTITIGAYLISSSAILVFAGVLSIAYLAGNLATLTDIGPLNLSIRIILFWYFTLIINYVVEHIRRSEGRLLGLFDTLNRRTSELEKIHAQLEMVYENSRILAGILDFNQVIDEVLKIGEKVLDYPAMGILLVGPGGNLIYRGRLVGGKINTKLKAATIETMELAYRVANENEPVRVIDISTRTDYQPLLKSARSVILVPMVTYGKTTGLLLAETPRKGAFDEQDEKFMSILARSAAMALDNAILHRKTEELTIIDDLTNVFNYRYFSEKLNEEKKRAVRYDLPLSLIMLDIDWFKKFNDNYGHEVGNRVLKGMVNVIKQCIRDVDILCRYGGEEFIVILPNTVARETHAIAKRIRFEVERAVFGGGENIPQLKVTVSVGVSSYPENGLTEEELINAVDQAMYRAKGSGKNTVCTV